MVAIRMARALPLAMAGCIILALSAAPAAAQEPREGFSLVFGIGYESGGWGESMLDGFAELDMADATPGVCVGLFCDPPIQFPIHYIEGIGVQFMAGFGYRFQGPFSVEVVASNGQWGHAEGYSESRDEHLLVIYRPTILISSAGVHLGPVRLGVGPALNRTSFDYDYNHGRTGSQKSLVLGMAGSAQVQLDVGQFVLAGRVDLRAFPETSVGNPTTTPLEVEYRSLTVGVSVHPKLGV